MNAVVQFDNSVPAFLRNAGFLALNQKAAAGLSTGAPPRLSFRGSRFRLIAADGTETATTDVLLTNADGSKVQSMGVALDVIVVDAADMVSKFYYDKAYDPNADDLSPACFSDNGVGPSVRANKPQSLTCAACPNAAWGSKVTPQGTQVKACSDIKKLAVVPVHNVTGPAYMLGIPAASLKTWSAAVKSVSDRGIPIPALVIRISFDPQAEYPKLTFSPVRYISQEEASAVQELFGSDEVAELVGSKDQPITALPGAAAPARQIQAQQHVMPQTQQPASVPLPVQSPQQATQAPIFAPPPAAATPAFLQQPQPAQAPAAQAAPRRRGRQAAGAANVPASPVVPAANVPAPPGDIGSMLDSIMGGAA